ncbi:MULTISPECIES: hypothetical protein [Bacillaceae]|uniref:DUF2178 domain-containing protein n=1 Tax=Evansella alkalicola TaxID=745819 RepID=A0ABS6K087_9BACI|nr:MULTISPECIES: hypothetical protein [Bacillaceae]MBU9722760.1 hypothetical protein [Bacillus alkalicola]
MSNTKKIVVTIGSLFFIASIIAFFYNWLVNETIYSANILFSFILLSTVLNFLNMKEFDKNEADELDQHVKTQSARIGYYVLMILAGLILFISEGTSNLNDIENYPLLLVVGLTLIIQPITEFLYARKYK